jgi:two-component system, NarL family, sensor histidine kinase UhpB
MRLSVFRLGERPTLQRVVLVDVVVVFVGAVAGTFLARHLSGASPWLLIGLFFTVGSLVLVLANYLVLRSAFSSLEQLSRAMAATHMGGHGRSVQSDASDPDLRTVSDALAEMVERIAGESRAYSSLIFESIEDERRRIGRELHDETSQSLAAALLNIDMALRGFEGCSREAQERVDNARALITHCLAQIKLLVYDLRPSMLDDFGLSPALRWYVTTHLDLSGLTVETDLESADHRLPPEVETGLYRIAQESLSNVVKHSGATRATLRLETRPGYAVLSVEDNGIGFDRQDTAADAADRYGVGMLSMRERTAALGGAFRVESAVGRGTRIYVVIPLEGGTRE